MTGKVSAELENYANIAEEDEVQPEVSIAVINRSDEAVEFLFQDSIIQTPDGCVVSGQTGSWEMLEDFWPDGESRSIQVECGWGFPRSRSGADHTLETVVRITLCGRGEQLAAVKGLLGSTNELIQRFSPEQGETEIMLSGTVLSLADEPDSDGDIRIDGNIAVTNASESAVTRVILETDILPKGAVDEEDRVWDWNVISLPPGGIHLQDFTHHVPAAALEGSSFRARVRQPNILCAETFKLEGPITE